MKWAVVPAAMVLGLGAAPAPSDRLADPAQEARARDLFRGIRCVVCQNESIDDSDAELASDLRRHVRSEVAAGRSDRRILADLTTRYGEFIRLRPSFSAANLALWVIPFLVVLGGLAALAPTFRRRSADRTPELTSDEERRLREIVTPPQV